ncbi:MAG: CusA/CzcA family heavy metal efflux RND transporter [Bdellovibrionaceae bacterium]|nr:CusA/CzcA family heavy metal efflux RND transporter [Pseudobdellovibrionaceae bacterium]
MRTSIVNRLISASVHQWGVTLLLTMIAVVVGWASFKSLPIDAVPDITNVQVTVNTPVEGLVPEEIERFITYPIESAMGGIPDVEEVRSITRFGLSQVTVVFKEGTSIYLSRQLVSERLQSAISDLPGNIRPQLGPITTGLGEVFFYSLSAKTPKTGTEGLKQLMDLRALQEWSITPRLLMVPGVAEVNTIGGFEKKYFVQPNLSKMAEYGIHVDQLVESIERNNRNTGGGYLQQTAEQLLVQATGIVHKIEDIEDIPVKQLDNLQTIRVKDIARVELAKELRTGAALVDGQETIIGTVLMLLGENSRAVAVRVKEKTEEIKKGLPEWVKIETVYDRSDLVNSTLETVEENLLLGAVLVFIVLLLLIGNFRVAVITAVTIPLAMLATVFLMNRFGISGNLMSLGALDFGIIIDGAVIVMDNCVRYLSERKAKLGRNLTRAEVRLAVSEATIEIRKAAGFGQIIIVMVFIPIFALSGVEGKMFIPMASAFCFALMAGFIISFSTVPALAGALLPGDIRDEEPRLMKQFVSWYQPVIRWALRRTAPIVIAAAGLIVTGLIVFSLMGSDFLPRLDEGAVAVQFVRPTDISIDRSVEMQELSDKVLLSFPEVDKVISRIGTSEIATDPMGANISDTYVLLKSKKDWPLIKGEKQTKSQLISSIKEALERRIPGQSLIFSQPIQLRFNELLEGVRADVAVKIFGDDMDKLSEISNQVAEVIKKVEGAGDAEGEIRGKSPVLRITPKMSVLNNLGVAKEEVLTTVETALGGKEAGSLYEGVMRFPILVRLSDQDRNNLEVIKKVPVGATRNLTVPMDKIANISVRETYSEIRRESSRKRVAVLVNVRGRDTASFVEEARSRIENTIKLPPGYYIDWGGSFRNLQSAKERLGILVPLALLAVLLMIYAAFRSVIQTALIFVSIPLALVGGVLGLVLNGLDFSISAAIGFIALSGIAVLNGVVLVSYFNQLKTEGKSGEGLIFEGTRIRLRPVLMTAFTDALGFLPMMLSTGLGAEVQRPLASVVVGGILTATALTLVVLPVLYRWLDEKGWIDVSKPK